MEKFNSWSVPFSSINWFEGVIKSHDKVISIFRERDILFTIETIYQKIYKVLLLDEYRMGAASVYRAIEEFGKLDFIVYGGNWNNATNEAYEIAKENNLALFNYSGFMGALNFEKPKEYIPNAKKKSSSTVPKRA